MTDDGGVLGNLPRSRPGQRSEKRRETSVARAATRAERTGSKAAAPAGKARAAGQTKAPGGGPPKDSRPQRAPAEDPRGDPVGEAIRTVTSVATIGPRVAVGVAREVFRRLPRP